ncbi:nitroreductase/quinone reductase family protein [Streptacidiphilus cavernicola]|uniref:Nitroreductase/quinone reductase family protein n=1 Tax=Streptacidiphilus cavernicola TaxID=3342716 RepID=A0ABV6VRP4_9ACTN
MAEQDQAQRLQWNEQVIEEFRANKGVVGGPFEGATLLLLTTRGAHTGLRRTMPLAALPAGEGRWAVFAANGGRPHRPGWYYNLVAEPEVTVELGTERFRAVAADAAGEERERLWAAQLAVLPALADFQATAPGPIPVVVLTRQGRDVSSDA